ncbi:MAG: hypothetical protein WBC33_12440, partial [Conexibacter sp.]
MADHAASRDLSTATWLCALPCAIAMLVALLVLGAPLGELIFPANPVRFMVAELPGVRPERTEQARFLIALTAPLLLAIATVAVARRAPR